MNKYQLLKYLEIQKGEIQYDLDRNKQQREDLLKELEEIEIAISELNSRQNNT